MKKIAIIGGGPGGYVAAIRLHQLGFAPLVFEMERLGGVCLNRGCIPTKAMVKSADVFHEINAADSFGIHVSDASVSLPAIIKRKDKIVEQLVGGVEFIFKKRKIEVIKQAVIKIKKDEHGFCLSTATDDFQCDKIIIATGSTPRDLPNIKFNGQTILSSRDILSMQEMPAEMAVIGGGVIGCEFASIFAQLGVKVHIVEYLPRLISTEDEEISKRLAMALKKLKIKIHTKTGVENCREIDGKLVLELSNKKELLVDKALLSVGRVPRWNVKCEGFDIATTKGAIDIDAQFKTNLDNIYAIGDVTAKMMLAHTASKMGVLLAEAIANDTKHAGLVYHNIPRCTFTNPEVASVGLTEAVASEQGEIKIGKFPFAANGKSLGLGNQFGFVKAIVCAKTDKLLGMHIIGPQATELIAQGALMIGSNAPLATLMQTVFAHPTLSEAVIESVEDAFDHAIHTV